MFELTDVHKTFQKAHSHRDPDSWLIPEDFKITITHYWHLLTLVDTCWHLLTLVDTCWHLTLECIVWASNEGSGTSPSGFFQNVDLSGVEREQPDVPVELRIGVWHEQNRILSPLWTEFDREQKRKTNVFSRIPGLSCQSTNEQHQFGHSGAPTQLVSSCRSGLSWKLAAKRSQYEDIFGFDGSCNQYATVWFGMMPTRKSEP